jgi:hypothetical protein
MKNLGERVNPKWLSAEVARLSFTHPDLTFRLIKT